MSKQEISNLEELRELDKCLDTINEALVKRNTLTITKDDEIVLKSINNKYNNIVGLINYLHRNQNELCKKN